MELASAIIQKVLKISDCFISLFNVSKSEFQTGQCGRKRKTAIMTQLFVTRDTINFLKNIDYKSLIPTTVEPLHLKIIF